MTSIAKPPLVHHQPLRLIYQAAKISYALVQFPFWVACAAFPSLRPDRNWTFGQTILIKVFRVIFDTLQGSVGVTKDRPIDKDKPGELVVVPATEVAPPEFYIGPLAASAAAAPTTIVGNAWVPGPPDTTSSRRQKVVMHIHGGAFVADSERAPATGYTAQSFLQHAHVDAVFVNRYRLSAYGGRNPFPAALQDVLTSYLYLVRTLCLDPATITISGDSAGGNLALGLLRYIEAFGAQLQIPKPGHLFLGSPWTNPCSCFPSAPGETTTMTVTPLEKQPKYRTDYLPVSILRFGATVYRPSELGVEWARKNEYVTPLGHPFETTVPIFMTIGTVEVLEPDATAWAAEMKAANGGDSVEVYYEDNAPHDTILAGRSLSFQDSVAKMLISFEAFLEKDIV